MGKLGVVYAWQVVALALLVTALGRESCARRWGQYRGHLVYFGSFLVLLGLVPAALLVALPGRADLAAVGFCFGHAGRGLVVLVFALAAAIPLLVYVAKNPALEKQYPLARLARWDSSRFVLYELVYVFAYYLAWEFTFRGLLFFPVLTLGGLLPALALPTTISTLLHVGHPDSEIWSAAAGGVLFGLAAYWTASFIYPFIIHAGLGVAHDTIRLLQQRRAAALAAD